MERLNYGGVYDDHEDEYGNHEQAHDHQDHQEREYEAEFDGASDDGYEEDDLSGVEHQAEFPAGTEAESDYAAVRFGWRSKARRGRRGRRWAPPDTRRFSAPAFVRLADLRSRPEEPAEG